MQRSWSSKLFGRTAQDADTGPPLQTDSIREAVVALRLPPAELVTRMYVKEPFILGKSSPDDGRLEQLQLLALRPDALWHTMQGFNESKIIVSTLIMALALTLLELSPPDTCGVWPYEACDWIKSVADWLALLSLIQHFIQVCRSHSSTRVLATVPPHRIHAFVADTCRDRKSQFNREGAFWMGCMVMFPAVGLHLLLRRPGPQGIVEAVVATVLPIVYQLRETFQISFQTRILWSLGWGHYSEKTWRKEAVLRRIGKYATELADDIEAAVQPPTLSTVVDLSA